MMTCLSPLLCRAGALALWIGCLGHTSGQTPNDAHWFYDYGGPSGDPFAMVQSENHLYMAGGFLNVAGSDSLKNLARFNLGTETWEQVPGINRNHANFIRALFADDEGNVWVGGDFSSIGGVEASRIAKFDTQAGTWSALRDGANSGPSGNVYAVAKSGDYVYVGGFILGDDATDRFIRRYDTLANKWEAVGAGLDDRVSALTVDSNGDIIAGGAFTGGIAKWNGSSWQVLGGGVDGHVRAIALGTFGQIYVGGDITKAGGAAASMVATYSGGQWANMDGGLKGGGSVNGIWGLTVDAAGRVYAAGDFDFTVSGDRQANKAAVFEDGAWQSLGSGLGNSSSQIVNTALAVGNDVYFGGVFAVPYGSANAKKNFARWNSDEDFSNYAPASTGGVVLQDTTREPVVADKHFFLDYKGPSGDPYAFAQIGDYIYMAGGFLTTAGDPNMKNLARFHLKWERWEPVPGISANHANFIRALHADAEGNLWVAGDFTSIGGVGAGKVAKFDPKTNTWSPLRDASAATDKAGPGSGSAYAVTRSGDYVYLGGFLFGSDDPAMRYVRRFNIITNTWESVGQGLNDTVRSFAVAPNGDVYAGGFFTSPGVSLAKWNGSTWSEVGGGLPNSSVRAIKLAGDGTLYVGGQFSQLNNGQAAFSVAAWNGIAWDTLNGGVQGGGSVNGIFGMDIDSAGRLYISGDFSRSTADETPLNKVAVYSEAGVWQPLGSGLGNSSSQIVNSVITVGTDAYFGGVFADANGSPNRKKNFARWNPEIDFRDYVPNEDAPPIAGEPSGPVFEDRYFYLDYGGPSTDPFELVKQGDYIYMAGGFLSTDGNDNMKNMARFHLLREKWETVPGIDWRHANFIRTMFADNEGNIWVGGDFTSIGGVSASKVAKFDTTTQKWSALRDNSTRVDRLGPTGSVYAICRSGDYVYIGGFIFASDDPAKRFIRRYNVITSTWESVGEGFNDRVNSLAVAPNGDVYAGGGFTKSGNTDLGGVARWDGTKWNDVGGGVDEGVREITFSADGKLYIGGQFSRAGGVAAGNVAVWNGIAWDGMNGGVYGGGSVNGVFDLSVDSVGRVYISGDFDAAEADSTRLNKVAVFEDGKWNPLGSGLGNSTSQIVNTVVTDGEDAYFGGVFADPNGPPNRKKNFARWNPNTNFNNYTPGANAPPVEDPSVPIDELAEANKHFFIGYGGPDGGDPYAMVQHGNYIYTAGNFQYLTTNNQVKTLARFNLTTESWEDVPGLDGNQGWVRSLDLDSEGNLWVGGDFGGIAGTPARRIAKFDTKTEEWSVLRDTNHPDEFGPVSGGAYATVRSGDYVYIGGFIFNSDNPEERYVRRFNLVTNTWESVGSGLNGRVNAMVVADNGDVIAGGTFSASGTTQLSSLARWNGQHWLPVGGGVEGSVRTMKFDIDGTLYVGGTFIQAGGTSVNNVASWNGLEWEDFNFGLNDTVWALDLDSDGRLYAAGEFSEAWIDGARLNKVAVFDSSETWQPLGQGVGKSSTQFATAMVAIGKDIYISGPFADPNGSPNRKIGMVRWNPDLDFTDYVPAVAPPAPDPTAPQRPADDIHWAYEYGGPSTDPFALEKLGNYLYIAGGFLSNDGDNQMKNMARFNLTSLQWERVPGITALHRNFIRSLEADSEGNLWVGGDFSSIGGVPANKIAKFDPRTNQWSSLLDFTAGDNASGPISGGVYAVARTGDYVYIGGFLFNHEDPAMRFIRRFNIKTNTWGPVGQGLDWKVETLEVAANGDLYAGGSFTGGLAKWDGTQWTEVGGGVSGVVRDIAFAPDGTLYVGGQFDQVGSQLANNVASWDGIFWNTLDGGIIGGGGVNGVFGMSIGANGKVYIGGDFDLADSDLSRLNKAAVWDGSGKWQPMGSGLGNSSSQIVNTVFADGNDIYMGGVFADPLGPPNRKKNFARWNETLDLSGSGDPAEPSRRSPFPSDIVLNDTQVNVSFQSTIGKSYSLQYSLDAQTWTTIGDTITGDGGGWFWRVNILEEVEFFRVTEQ